MNESKVRILELKEKVLIDNDADAEVLRQELDKKKTYFINVMSSPGSGKTTTLMATCDLLKSKYNIGIMEADIDGDTDTKTAIAAGIPAIQLHTGGMCHLSADMSRQALLEIGSDNFDVIFLENVGNLVCPAEFDTGAHLNVVILSVPEGDDKPLKYPLMFEKADVVLINKIDAMEAFDFEMDNVKAWIAQRNETVSVFPISAETGEGIDAWCNWLVDKIESHQEA